MANTIRIKRRASSGNSGAPGALKNGEIAFNENDKTLYYGLGDDGSGNATSIPAIGGLSGVDGDRSDYLENAYVTLDTAQTVSGNKTFSGTTTATGTLDVTGTFKLNGTTVSSSAAELNLLDNVTGLVKADFTKLAAVDATAVELNKLDGATASTTELNYVTGVTSGIQSQLNGKQASLTFGIANNNAVKIDHASVADDDYAKFTASGLEGISSSELVAELGAITSVAAGNLIDVDSSSGGLTKTVNVDLTELADMTGAFSGSDEFVVLDVPSSGSSLQKRKAASEIPLSVFNNDLTDNNTTYDLSVPASTTKIRLAGSDSTNDDITISGGSNVTVTRTSATQLTIASSFTNTTYTAGSNGGLVLDGTAFRIDGDNMATKGTLNADDYLIVHRGDSGGFGLPKTKQINAIPISGFKTDVATSITSTGTLDNLTVTGDVDITTGDLTITAGNLRGPSTFYIDPAAYDSPHSNNSPAATGLVVIRGDLQVDGTTTTINSTEITIEDSTFTVASGTSGLANLDDTGIHFGANDEIKFEYDHSNTTMVLNQALKITGELDGATIDGGTF